jgi:hypothetical protein
MLLSAALIAFGAVISSAQESSAPAARIQDATPPQPPASQRLASQDDATTAATATDAAQKRSDADETFELNISERRITERDFNASTSVEAGEESARGLRLRIGVGVGAQQIDVLLRNVHGSVHFRGTLERVLELINTRRQPETRP